MQTTNRKIRVLVVDDSAVARSVIIQGLSASPRIEVVGYAVNAMDAKTKLQHLSPDVMTLDVEMPGINGIDFLKQFLPSHPLPVILVSSLNLRVFDALAAGAVDFVRKPDAVESRESFLQALTHKTYCGLPCQVIPCQPAPPCRPRRSATFWRRWGAGADRHWSGRLHRRHRGHAERAQAAPGQHSRHGDRTAHAGRVHQDVCRAPQPSMPNGSA